MKIKKIYKQLAWIACGLTLASSVFADATFHIYANNQTSDTMLFSTDTNYSQNIGISHLNDSAPNEKSAETDIYKLNVTRGQRTCPENHLESGCILFTFDITVNHDGQKTHVGTIQMAPHYDHSHRFNLKYIHLGNPNYKLTQHTDGGGFHLSIENA